MSSDHRASSVLPLNQQASGEGKGSGRGQYNQKRSTLHARTGPPSLTPTHLRVHTGCVGPRAQASLGAGRSPPAAQGEVSLPVRQHGLDTYWAKASFQAWNQLFSQCLPTLAISLLHWALLVQ